MKIEPSAYIKAVRDIAAENPDMVYEAPKYLSVLGEWCTGSCVYVEKDKDTNEYVASCIHGHALIRLGVDPEILDLGPWSIYSLLESTLGLTWPSDVIYWCAAVQNYQDGDGMGCTVLKWPEAVAKADEDWPGIKKFERVDG